MKVIFLDNDGVICLYNNWGGRAKKWKKFKKLNPEAINDKSAPVDVRFDDFDKKSIKILNKVSFVASSTIWPRYITATLSQIWRTTLKS